MSTESRNLVVVITHGPEDEKASVGFTIANGGMTAGLTVSVCTNLKRTTFKCKARVCSDQSRPDGRRPHTADGTCRLKRAITM